MNEGYGEWEPARPAEAEWMTREALGKLFERSPRTIYRWLAAGKLPCYRMPDGRTLVRRDDVEGFLNHCYCPPRGKKQPRLHRPKPSPLPWLLRQNMTLHDGELPANIPR